MELKTIFKIIVILIGVGLTIWGVFDVINKVYSSEPYSRKDLCRSWAKAFIGASISAVGFRL